VTLAGKPLATFSSTSISTSCVLSSIPIYGWPTKGYRSYSLDMQILHLGNSFYSPFVSSVMETESIIATASFSYQNWKVSLPPPLRNALPSLGLCATKPARLPFGVCTAQLPRPLICHKLQIRRSHHNQSIKLHWSYFATGRWHPTTDRLTTHRPYIRWP
jgi:hypothetical protein